MTKIGFLLCYLLAMLPTYILPYFGSNSVVGQAMWASGSRTGMGLLFTALHVGALVGCVYIAWARGAVNGKRILTGLAVIAAAFDMLPLLSMIPLVPSIMHVVALVLGFDDSNEVEDVSDIPAAARHPFFVLPGIAAVAIVVGFIVSVAATVPYSAEAFKAGRSASAASSSSN